MRRYRTLLYYSFPFQLVVLHFRNHLMLVVLWLFLGLLTTGAIGRFFGVYHLLLTPEYLGEVNFWSFLLTGAACGAFFLIWNLTTYLLCSHRFPFLATLKAPFTLFSLNNSVFPLVFIIVYVSTSVVFQVRDELATFWDVMKNTAGLLIGLGLMLGVLAVYLHFTNKDLASILKAGNLTPKPGSRLLTPEGRVPTMREIRSGATSWRVDTYLSERFHLRLVRSVAHYDRRLLAKVFQQNHLNAVLVQLMALIVIMFLSLFMEQPWARIPTGATIFLLASMFMALFGAIVYWFRRWAVLVFLALLAAINAITSWGLFYYRNRAYGIDYAQEHRAEYTHEQLERLCAPDTIARDAANARRILERWAARNRGPHGEKPKMVLVCVSGGGMRSAVWTMHALQQADLATQGQLMRHSVLISGASGGILGAAYWRELYLRQQLGENVDYNCSDHVAEIGADLLNAVSFAILTNDLFFPFRKFQSGNFTYRKDRGYLLEYQLNENCRGRLNRRLADYRTHEKQARIPMMVVSPFLLNDARRLLISPQGVSYLMRPPGNPTSTQPEIDAVDFGRLFARQQADSLAFTSALRMNCSYPLILPPVWLPTDPPVEAMDAGFRDNYGIATAVRFAHALQDWIKNNTDGVIVLQVRCWEKRRPIEASTYKGIVENVLSPFSAAAHLTAMQDFEQDNALALLRDLLGPDQLQVIRLVYRPQNKENEASMSFHLSKREKRDILQAIHDPDVQRGLQQLRQALAPR
ncbi:MAG: patatin-like phospholipase family protein [Saprospiraceae bacterium]|nr:patatin-like phospholipase family protein [Saprospiraceae bacterium]MDW8230593.1 patatin-like phospholipase family protein [Saprospiraceae bacterium]